MGLIVMPHCNVAVRHVAYCDVGLIVTSAVRHGAYCDVGLIVTSAVRHVTSAVRHVTSAVRHADIDHPCPFDPYLSFRVVLMATH